MTTIERWTPQEVADAAALGGPLLVDLRADWCVQCGPQERVLERLAPEYAGRLTITSVDVGEHPELVDAHAISSLPALLLFQRGELRAILRGFQRAPQLREALRQHLD